MVDRTGMVDQLNLPTRIPSLGSGCFPERKTNISPAVPHIIRDILLIVLLSLMLPSLVTAHCVPLAFSCSAWVDCAQGVAMVFAQPGCSKQHVLTLHEGRTPSLFLTDAPETPTSSWPSDDVSGGKIGARWVDTFHLVCGPLLETNNAQTRNITSDASDDSTARNTMLPTDTHAAQNTSSATPNSALSAHVQHSISATPSQDPDRHVVVNSAVVAPEKDLANSRSTPWTFHRRALQPTILWDALWLLQADMPGNCSNDTKYPKGADDDDVSDDDDTDK